MTTSGSRSGKFDNADITALARVILDADRRTPARGVPPRPRPQPRPRPRPRGVDRAPLVSLRVPAVVLELLVGCWIVFGVVAIANGFAHESVLHRIAQDPERITFAEVGIDQHRADAINGISLGLLVLTGIAFVVWFQRAYRNLDALGIRRRYGTGWAIGGWFVPFLNLARPKQIADDIWASVVLSKRGDTGVRGESELLVFWWTAWLGSTILGLFAGPRDTTNQTVGSALAHNGFFIAHTAVTMIAAVLVFFVVRAITRAQTVLVVEARTSFRAVRAR